VLAARRPKVETEIDKENLADTEKCLGGSVTDVKKQEKKKWVGWEIQECIFMLRGGAAWGPVKMMGRREEVSTSTVASLVVPDAIDAQTDGKKETSGPEQKSDKRQQGKLDQKMVTLHQDSILGQLESALGRGRNGGRARSATNSKGKEKGKQDTTQKQTAFLPELLVMQRGCEEEIQKGGDFGVTERGGVAKDVEIRRADPMRKTREMRECGKRARNWLVVWAGFQWSLETRDSETGGTGE